MAKIKTIDMEGYEICVNLKVSKEEYDLLKEENKNLLVLPTTKLNETLTTGKIGNSNRIMIPNKLLKRNNIEKLLKHVESRVFNVDGRKFLLIKLGDFDSGIPRFEEAKE